MYWTDIKHKPAIHDGRFRDESYLSLHIATTDLNNHIHFKYANGWGSFVDDTHENVEVEEIGPDLGCFSTMLEGYYIAQHDELKKAILMGALELTAFGDVTEDWRGIAKGKLEGVVRDALENAVISIKDLTLYEVRSYLPIYANALTPGQRAEIVAASLLTWYNAEHEEDYMRANFHIDKDLVELVYPNKVTEIDLFFDVLIDKILRVKGNYEDTIKIFQDFGESKVDEDAEKYELPDLGME